MKMNLGDFLPYKNKEVIIMDFYVFGLICIIVVTVIAFILAFKGSAKNKSKTNHNLIVESLNNSNEELSDVLNNLKIYNDAMEDFND